MKSIRTMGKISFTTYRKVWLITPIFIENITAQWHYMETSYTKFDPDQPNNTESMGANAYTHTHTHKLTTTITELISTKPTLAEQLSKTLLYRTSQKPDNLSADTMSQGHRQTLSPHKASYLLCKGMHKNPVSAKHKSTPITKFKYLMLFILIIIKNT